MANAKAAVRPAPVLGSNVLKAFPSLLIHSDATNYCYFLFANLTISTRTDRMSSMLFATLGKSTVINSPQTLRVIWEKDTSIIPALFA